MSNEQYSEEFEAFRGQLKSYILRITASVADTEDIVQDTYLKAVEKPDKKMAWGDGQGNRVYTLTDHGNGTLSFFMQEKIGGFMFPLYAKYIPPFDQSFEQFAADLKREAEIIANTKN